MWSNKRMFFLRAALVLLLCQTSMVRSENFICVEDQKIVKTVSHCKSTGPCGRGGRSIETQCLSDTVNRYNENQHKASEARFERDRPIHEHGSFVCVHKGRTTDGQYPYLPQSCKLSINTRQAIGCDQKLPFDADVYDRRCLIGFDFSKNPNPVVVKPTKPTAPRKLYGDLVEWIHHDVLTSAWQYSFPLLESESLSAIRFSLVPLEKNSTSDHLLVYNFNSSSCCAGSCRVYVLDQRSNFIAEIPVKRISEQLVQWANVALDKNYTKGMRNLIVDNETLWVWNGKEYQIQK